MTPPFEHVAPKYVPQRTGIYVRKERRLEIALGFPYQLGVDVEGKMQIPVTGMNQAGLAKCFVRSINACHPHLHPLLYENIVLTGGSTLFPRFKERLETELRPLVPAHYGVKLSVQGDPILGVWQGGSQLASRHDFEEMCVTKSEYEELGSTRCRRRFFS